MTQQSYIGSIITQPSKLLIVPVEGARFAIANINWSEYYDVPSIDQTITVNVNVNSGVNPLSQIAAMGVFNKSPSGGCTINFKDTGQSMFVDAFSSAFFPVNTTLLNFDIIWDESYAPGDQDVVSVNIFNFVPPSLAPNNNTMTVKPATRMLALLNGTFSNAASILIAGWTNYATITTVKAKLQVVSNGMFSLDNLRYAVGITLPHQGNIAYAADNNLDLGASYDVDLCNIENAAIQALTSINFSINEIQSPLQINASILVEYIL